MLSKLLHPAVSVLAPFAAVALPDFTDPASVQSWVEIIIKIIAVITGILAALKLGKSAAGK